MHQLTRHRWWFSALALAMGPTLMHAQTGDSQYVPVVPNASMVGGYGGAYGGGHASTLEEGAMNGMANVMSAAGDYNLATSAAAVNLTQAQRNDIQNRQMNTQAYFDIQATNRAARAQKAGAKPAMEQLTRVARQGTPKALQPNQFDAVTGALNWPATLMDSTFNLDRNTVDQMFAKRAAQGTLGIADQAALRQAVENLDRQLKGLVQVIQTQDYVESKKFLQSAMYTGVQRLL